jgi:hypothetical protein
LPSEQPLIQKTIELKPRPIRYRISFGITTAICAKIWNYRCRNNMKCRIDYVV